MSVRIHEAGKNDASAEIEFFGAARGTRALDAAPRANGGDAVVMNKQSTVANDAEIGERAPRRGTATAQSKQLRAAGNQPVSETPIIIGCFQC